MTIQTLHIHASLFIRLLLTCSHKDPSSFSLGQQWTAAAGQSLKGGPQQTKLAHLMGIPIAETVLMNSAIPPAGTHCLVADESTGDACYSTCVKGLAHGYNLVEVPVPLLGMEQA